MSFVIDDSDLPCTAAGIGGVFVPEELTILEVCQDSNDLGIVYIIATIRGVYAYTPQLEVSWNGNSAVFDAQYIPGYKGEGVESFPIDNKCQTKTVTLAYNLGSVIEEFKTVAELGLHLTFNGTSDLISESEVINQTFQSSNPSAEYTFIKGLTPTPYKVYFDNVTDKFKVQFVGLGDKPCICAIDCAVPTQEDLDIAVCKDEAQEVTINKNSIVGDPSEAQITFIDSVGNQSTLDISIAVGMTPRRPQALHQTEPDHVRVTFAPISKNGAKIDNVAYQIVRYKGTSDSAKIWKDWSKQPISSFVDADVKQNNKYGYAIRFRDDFGGVSNLSDWATVTIS